MQVKKNRLSVTKEERQCMLDKDRARKQNMRDYMTTEERRDMLDKDAARKQNMRDNMTTEERRDMLDKDAARNQDMRDNMTTEERRDMLDKDAARNQEMRDNLTPKERKDKLNNDKCRKRTARQLQFITDGRRIVQRASSTLHPASDTMTPSSELEVIPAEPEDIPVPASASSSNCISSSVDIACATSSSSTSDAAPEDIPVPASASSSNCMSSSVDIACATSSSSTSVVAPEDIPVPASASSSNCTSSSVDIACATSSSSTSVVASLTADLPQHHRSNNTSPQLVHSFNNTPTLTVNSNLHYIGQMSWNCPHCAALRFPAERLNCCHNGKVNLPSDEYPESLSLRDLFTNKDFLDKIRSYNNIFAFASLGAQIKPPPGYGPYCFRIHGQMYHRTSTLHPGDGERRRYGQVYILEGAEAVDVRKAADHRLREDVIRIIQEVIDEINPYASSYRNMRDLEREEQMRAAAAGVAPELVTMIFREGKDKRRYNAPSNEVAAVFIGDDGAPPGNHDIVVYPRNNPLRRISYMNDHCDPMIYPLLFPTGQLGWDSSQLHNSAFRTAHRNQVSQLQFYSYRLAFRRNFSMIHRSSKLFQQYMVDAYVKTEAERLTFIKTHQSQLRVDKYQGLMDHVHNEAASRGMDVGKIVILPSTFAGSPRNMQQEYQDSMAIVSRKGKPDAFLTYTCNPKSREITENLLPGQTASDRPDIVARVFKLKLEELKTDLLKRDILGKVIAHVHVIEFQKRGLPHAHMLLWFDQDSKLRTADDVDRLISAEIPDPSTQRELYEIIKSTMMHGPCGIVDEKTYDKSPCMSSGSCSKNFPKEFSETTNINVDGYPIYRRRNNGRTVTVRGCTLDNRWVVPYNEILSLRYGSHINLEACMSIKSVKYLFKYVYKGHDCIDLEVSEKYNHDEIKTYLDARYVSAPEAMWRLSEFEMHGKSHVIIRLPVHVPNQQNVYFRSGNEEEALARYDESALTAWFKLNQTSVDAREHLYVEIPKHYVFHKKQGEWKTRQRGGNKVIGRMYSCSPKDKERYCLRVLLLHVRGATSFEDLRSYNGHTYSTFHEACIARGLLEDDQEWDRALSEAIALMMPRQCRQLFVTILTHCNPSEPNVLWERYQEGLAEDFAPDLPPEQAIQCALADIDARLAEFQMSCESVGLPIPDPDSVLNLTEVDPLDDASIASRNMSLLNVKQREVVDTILEKVQNSNSAEANVFYLDGPAGTGKTMVYNTLISLLRSTGRNVASCAWTGIASILLRNGVTVHNLFKLPVPILDTSTCNVSPSSPYAEYLRSLSLILIDEASMIPNHALHAIDRLLRDILNNDIPFGGKLILFGGDFRQVLPVVVRGTATKILEQCLKRSHLWQYFHVFELTENMRAHEEEREFARWLLKLGNGTLQSQTATEDDVIDIPHECVVDNIVDTIFPNFDVDRRDSVILTPKNDTSLQLNDEILERLPGQNNVFLSCDNALCDDEEEAQNYPLEFLNSITPTGMPPHQLNLKVGCTVMLLRNLCSKRGLCNGVRLKVLNIHTALLHCEIITGSHSGNQVLIPKLKLAPSDVNLPFTLQRIQFPMRLSYSMTINKSQGQTFNHVGIYLREPVFSHGQLYVAFSRATTLDGVKVLLDQQEKENRNYVTKNVVYKDIL